jgi:hypothetical protein
VHPVIPLRGVKGKQPTIPIEMPRATRLFPRIPRHSDEFKTLYRGRGAVEREFGRLKTLYGLAPLRVRRVGRVQLHADLVIMARLALALHRAQDAPVAA